MSSEADIQNAIRLALGRRNDLFLWRNNTGTLRDQRGIPVTFGLPGSPDIIGILRGGRGIGIEVKSQTGRQTPQQAKFQAKWQSLGGAYCIARSVDEAIAFVERAIAEREHQ